jgi:hypothetical protein
VKRVIPQESIEGAALKLRTVFWTALSWIAARRRDYLYPYRVYRTIYLEPDDRPSPPLTGAGRRDARLRRVLSYMHTHSGSRALAPCLACRCFEILNGVDRALDDDELRKGALS